jgi:putative membrane protein
LLAGDLSVTRLGYKLFGIPQGGKRMSTTIIVFASIGILFHTLAFVLESLLFMRPAVYKRFQSRNEEEAKAARLFAFNQGFYNLFLAAGCLAGLLLWHHGIALVGATLVMFTCACMLGAALVLLYTSRRMWRPALYQGLPPAMVLGLYFF